MTVQKYRKKPVIIEAMQYDGTWQTVLQWLDAIGYKIPFLGKPAIVRTLTGDLAIDTLEGTMTARVNDWVIRGVKGEFYPCKPDIFAATYEAVESE